MAVHIQTFGCKVNFHDSSLMRKKLQETGFDSSLMRQSLTRPYNSFSEGRQVFLINTCAVTREAGKEALRTAEKIKRRNNKDLVVVTGCGAQADTEIYERSKNVDLVIGNSHRENLPNILNDFLKNRSSVSENIHFQKVFKSNIFKNSDVFSGSFLPEPDRTRVFLKIQDGCDSFCTFCIIPFGRGKSRSLKISDIVHRSKELVQKQQIKEIVFTGVHIGDYRDGNKDLGDLVEALLSQTRLERIRLSSLEPPEITDKLLDCFEEERMCPHFHLSIQSASTPVLKGMKRKYGQKEVEKSLHVIEKKVPKAFVGMDLIAGFPEESQENFEETYEVLKNTPWTRIHVFPYSPRPGTLSARKSGLERSEILKRASFFRRLSNSRYRQEMKKQIGTIKKVLLFKKNKDRGLSRDYWNVHIPKTFSSSEEVSVVIKDMSETALLGSDILLTYEMKKIIRKV